MSMKKNVPSNEKRQDINEAYGQHVPATGSTGKPNNFKDMMQESEERKADPDLNDRAEDDSSRTGSGAEETNY